MKQEDNKRIIELSKDFALKIQELNCSKRKPRKKRLLRNGKKNLDQEKLLKRPLPKAKRVIPLLRKPLKKPPLESQLKAKEAAKAAKKKNKRNIRAAVKDNNYFGDSAKSADIDADVDLLIEKFDDVKLKRRLIKKMLMLLQ